MFKIKVSSKLRAVLINKLQKTVDEQFVQDMQREVIDNTIKPLIAAGVSPVDSVEGSRRFVGYKDPEKYPGTQKSKRPVNLFLSGKMLQWYKAVKISGVRISLGIPTTADNEIKVRAQANNEGTAEGIPPRRFIPLRGESFRVSVMRKIKDLYARRIKFLLSSK